MLYQEIVKRECKTIDEGTMGFKDFVTHNEKLEEFINRVTERMNQLNTIYVSYPNEYLAIIQYWKEDEE